MQPKARLVQPRYPHPPRGSDVLVVVEVTAPFTLDGDVRIAVGPEGLRDGPLAKWEGDVSAKRRAWVMIPTIQRPPAGLAYVKAILDDMVLSAGVFRVT